MGESWMCCILIYMVIAGDHRLDNYEPSIVEMAWLIKADTACNKIKPTPMTE